MKLLGMIHEIDIISNMNLKVCRNERVVILALM